MGKWRQRGTFLLWMGGALLALHAVGCLAVARWLAGLQDESQVPGHATIAEATAGEISRILMLHFAVPGGLALLWGLVVLASWWRAERARERSEAVARAEAEAFLHAMQEAAPRDQERCPPPR